MPPIRIGNVGDSDDQIQRAYLAAKKTLLDDVHTADGTIGNIVEKYLDSVNFKEKAPATQRNYRFMAKAVLAYPVLINKQEATLSDMQLTSLTKPVFNALREKRYERLQAQGKKGNVTVNREGTFLQTAIKWGLNHMPGLPNIVNPLNNLEKFKEEANKRYVDDREFEIQYNEAKIACPDWLPVFMRLTYLFGTRGVETAEIKESHLINEGVEIARRKNSDDNIIAWSPAIREAIKEAKALNHTRKKITMINPYIITNTRGEKISQAAIQNAMGELKKHMHKIGKGELFWTLHRMKSKAITDSKDDNIGGHKTDAMKARYTNKKKVIDSGLK